MIKIQHRVNTRESLKMVSPYYGAEIDIRYHNNDLILSHDPFHHHEKEQEYLDDFLAHYRLQGPLILNVKTEGIEERCLDLLNKYHIENFFFLDISMPYFVRYAKYKPILKHMAVRFSEHEPLEYALSFAGDVDWVWVDCFTQWPLNGQSYSSLKAHNFKICLVSPELQNHSVDKIVLFREQIEGMEIDAVCTKRPDLW